MTDRQYFFRAFKYIRPYFFIYAIGIFAYSSQAFIFPFISGLFIGGVTDGIVNADFSLVITAIRNMAFMLVGVMVIVGGGTYLYIVAIAHGIRDMGLHLFRSFMRAGIESESHTGEGIAAMNTDLDTTSNIFSDAMSGFLSPVIAAVLSTIAVFAVDWRLGFVALFVGILIFAFQAGFAKPLAKLGKRQLDANADGVKAMSNIFAGALTIRAFGRQPQSLRLFDIENGKLKKLAFKQAFIGMWQNIFGTVQSWLSLVLVFGFGGWLVATGRLTLPELMIIFPIASALAAAVSQIGAAYANLQPPVVAAKRVFGVIDAAGEKLTPQEDFNFDGSYVINLNGLNFQYKNGTANALDNINLTIKENEMVAFVGESGSGKSTLLRTIMGLYERETLNMQVGNLKFSPCRLLEWRKHFSYVDQSCKLFDMTIGENIAMGNQGEATEEQIKAAAKRAFAHDFIEELTEGYATACGEKGASLSGGQKQRIAIARALCRKADVLVFDEATSALDADSEAFIMQTIENLRTDHTILLTTHNLNNVKTADKIVVMENGSIAQIGSHNELMEKGGLYKRLVEEQNAV